MAISDAFGTTVNADNPTDPTQPNGSKVVSDFITVASFTNFSAMTGAVATAWGALRQVSDKFDGNWLPFAACMLFALVSVIASKPGKDCRSVGASNVHRDTECLN